MNFSFQSFREPRKLKIFSRSNTETSSNVRSNRISCLSVSKSLLEVLTFRQFLFGLPEDSTVYVEIETIIHYTPVAHTNIRKYLYLSNQGRGPPGRISARSKYWQWSLNALRSTDSKRTKGRYSWNTNTSYWGNYLENISPLYSLQRNREPLSSKQS